MARRAADRVLRERRGSVVSAVATAQASQAVLADRAVGQMLAEQGVETRRAAELSPAGFSTASDRILEGIERATNDYLLTSFVTSLVQDAGRSAQSVSIASRPGAGWVRQLTLPSCSRCAVLGGRVYRYSQGFQRHPRCDCTMIPVAESTPDSRAYDITALVRGGQVKGLSVADRKALESGADFGRVVNTRSQSAGLHESGRVLYRQGRMTPEAIYRQTGADQDAALALLQRNGYIR